MRRIGTLNCGHSAFPIILGFNAPQYTDEELEKLRKDNADGVTIDGRHYTKYEATQIQRKIERAIRKQKNRILVDEAAGDKDKLLTDQIRLQRYRQEYVRFSGAARLRTQNERAQVAGFGRKQAAEAVAAEKSLTTSRKYNWKPTDLRNQEIADMCIVQDLQQYEVDGVTYTVDGHNVVLDYSQHEKETAELLAKEIGGEMFMVPRINNPQGVSTPDYLFNGKGYDLKTIMAGAGPNTIFNRVKKARRQAKNFVLDLSASELDDKTIDSQISKIFRNKSTEFVDEIIIVRDGKIVKIVKRV